MEIGTVTKTIFDETKDVIITWFGVVSKDSPFRPIVGGNAVNWGRTWASGQTAAADGPVVAAIVHDYPAAPGEVTLVFGDNGIRQYTLTLFITAFERDVAAGAARAIYGGGPSILMSDQASLEVVLPRVGMPIEAVTLNASKAAFIRRMQAEHPQLRIRLVDLPGRYGS